MIEPIHCCKHSLKIAMVFQGYPEFLFVSLKAFDDKEVNRASLLLRRSKVFMTA
jgi:predicted metal-binding protein